MCLKASSIHFEHSFKLCIFQSLAMSKCLKFSTMMIQVHTTHKNELKKKHEIWSQTLSLFSNIILGINFNFERAPPKLQRSIKSKKKKKKQWRERGGKNRGRSPSPPLEKTEITGAVWFSGAQQRQIRKNVQTSESAETFNNFVGSLNLFGAAHRVEWTWQFGKIENRIVELTSYESRPTTWESSNVTSQFGKVELGNIKK